MSIPPYTDGAFILDGTVELRKLLGVGGYAFVYHAVDHTVVPPQEFAVKCLPNCDEEHIRRMLRNETKLHSLVRDCPDVVPIHRVAREGDRAFIFMDLCRGGDLHSAIVQSKRFDGNDALIRRVFLQIVDAVTFIHKCQVYHRDIKPENILFTDASHSRALLTDFGLATRESFSSEFRCGTPGYIAPESYSRRYSGENLCSPHHCDVWALGVLLINMATGKTLWEKPCVSDPLFAEYLRAPHYFFLEKYSVSPEVNHLLLRMLTPDWKNRISMRDLRAAASRILYFTQPWEDIVGRRRLVAFPGVFPPVQRIQPPMKKPQQGRDAFIGTYFDAAGIQYAPNELIPPSLDSPYAALPVMPEHRNPHYISDIYTVEQTRYIRHSAAIHRYRHHADALGLCALDDGGRGDVIHVDDFTSENDIRSYWQSDSDNTSTGVSSYDREDLAGTMAPSSSPGPSPQKRNVGKRKIRTWLRKVFLGNQQRPTHVVPVSLIEQS